MIKNDNKDKSIGMYFDDILIQCSKSLLPSLLELLRRPGVYNCEIGGHLIFMRRCAICKQADFDEK